MAVSDIYTFRATPTLSAASATALLSVINPATIRGWVVGIRVEIEQTAAAAGNDILFQLCRPGNTPTGTGAFNGSAHDFSAPSGLPQGYATWSTAPTIGTILASETLPMTTGSEWVEYPPTNYEWQIPAIANGSANCGLHLFATPTAATSTPVIVEVIVSV